MYMYMKYTYTCIDVVYIYYIYIYNIDVIYIDVIDVERYLIIYIKTETMEKQKRSLLVFPRTGFLVLMKSPFIHLSNSIQQNFILRSKNLCWKEL